MSRKLLCLLGLIACSIMGLILVPLQPSVALQSAGGAPNHGGVVAPRAALPRAVAQVGHIASNVKNAITNAPVVGAQIQATGSAQTAQVNSDADGAYTLDLLEGTYTLAASAHGYVDWSAPNLSVTSGATTTQDINLAPMQTYVLSGYVKDAQGGWPLYALLSLSAPGLTGPVGWSDPVTGYYSLTVAGGVAQTLAVQAWSSGYQPQSIIIPPMTGNTTRDVNLAADLSDCSAPGYKKQGFIEDFDQLTPPSLGGSWASSVIASTGGLFVPQWATNAGTRNPAGIPAHSEPNLVFFNSFSASPGGAARLYQIFSLNMTALPTTTLSFWMYHDPGYVGYNDQVQVQVSTDGGGIWQNVGAPISRYSPTAGWLEHTVDLSAYGAVVNLWLGFLGTSAIGNDIHLDDITIATCQVRPGGLVVGNVYDANTGATLNGATISGPLGTTTSGATSDPTVDEGFFAMFAPPGSQSFSASKTGGYGSSNQVITVVANNTVRRNFSLPAARLQVNAPTSAVAVTLTLNTLTSTNITLQNIGTVLGASYNIVEMYAPAYTPIQYASLPIRRARQLSADDFKPAASFSPTDQPAAPDTPELPTAGAVIASWPISGVLSPSWGIGVNTYADDLWIAEFKSGGNNFDYRFLRDGTNTGNKTNAYFGGSFALDMTYNPHTGMLWQVNFGGDNCIYELDPNTLAQTGNKVCPPFSTRQMGLAYDPISNTFYSGSWYDRIINHFTADGVLLDSKYVNANIAGLAYNPSTQHLFVTCFNCYSYDIYVLDAGNNYAYSGSLSVTDLNGGEAGLDMSCDGHLWAVNRATARVYEIDSGETGVCAVPWLNSLPSSGTIAVSSNQPTTLAYDASQVSQPGLYQARLWMANNTPYAANTVNVQMQVLPPVTWGKLSGTVYGLGRCDANPAPLKNAQIQLQSAAGTTWTLRSSTGGSYAYWLNASTSPLTITTSAPGLVTQVITGVNITAQAVTDQDLNLRAPAPCAGVAPTALSTALRPDQQRTVPLTVTNSGAVSMTWDVKEAVPGALDELTPLHDDPHRPAGSRSAPLKPLSDILGDGGFEAGTPNPFWVEYSRTYETPLCNEASCGTSNGNGKPHSGDWWAWFGGSSASDFSWITQTIVLTTGASAELRFWVWVSTPAMSDSDYLRVYLDATQIYTAEVGITTTDYVQEMVSLNAFTDSQPHILRFESETSGYSNFNVDDVVVNVSGVFLNCEADTMPWVNVTPLSGTIPAHSNTVLNVQFDSTGLISGTRAGTLCVNTSDSGEPQLGVPVALTVQRPDMMISTSAPAVVFAGDPITYTIVYTNVGNAAASGVVITDTLPVSVTTTMTTTWSIEAVPPGKGGTIKLGALVDTEVVSGTLTANTVIVGSDDDLDPSNNSSMTITKIVQYYRAYLPLIRR